MRATELAAELEMSYATLHRLTNEFFDCSPGTLLRRIRVRQAKELLHRTKDNTARVAYRAGFGTRRSLFRAFKKETGLTPRSQQR